MLNLELARIVIQERRRTTEANLRQARFQLDLADRQASVHEAAATATGPAKDLCADAGQRAKPALG